MTYLALSETQLSRFSHHWFWGLRVDVSGAKSLDKEALSLENNPIEKNAIIEQQTQIMAFSWLFRSVFWLFNINQYRLNYYKLQSYSSLQLYKQGVNMLSQDDLRNAEAIGAFLIVLSVAAIILKRFSPEICNAVEPGRTWFFEQVMSNLPSNLPQVNKNATSHVHLTSEHSPLLTNEIRPTLFRTMDEEAAYPKVVSGTKITSFTVKQVMLSSLRTLDIITQTGEEVLFSTLKTAYINSLMRTHPDKTQSNSCDAFIAVRQAYSLITDLHTKTQSSSNGEYASFAMTKEQSLIVAQLIVSVEALIETTRAENTALRAKNAIDRAKVEADKIKTQAHKAELEDYQQRNKISLAEAEVSRIKFNEEMARLDAEEAEVVAIVELINMYDAVESYPHYELRGKNRNSFVVGTDCSVAANVDHVIEPTNPIDLASVASQGIFSQQNQPCVIEETQCVHDTETGIDNEKVVM